MKKINLAQWSVTALAACIFAIASRAGFCEELKVDLSEIKGSVKYRVSDEANWQIAAKGMRLGKEVSIRSEKDSSAVITWHSNMVKVHPLTEVKLETIQFDPGTGNQKSLISLMNGRVFSRAGKIKNAENDFAVKTATTLAGVRGTEFGVHFNLRVTMVAVLTGMVAVKAEGAEVLVSDALHTLIQPGEPPGAPEEIPAELMEQLKADLQELDEIEAAATAAAGEGAAQDKGKSGEAEKKGEGAQQDKDASQQEDEKGAGKNQGETSGDTAGDEQDPAGMGDAGNIAEGSMTGSLNEQINNDISVQDEIFEGCCQAR